MNEKSIKLQVILGEVEECLRRAEKLNAEHNCNDWSFSYKTQDNEAGELDKIIITAAGAFYYTEIIAQAESLKLANYIVLGYDKEGKSVINIRIY